MINFRNAPVEHQAWCNQFSTGTDNSIGYSFRDDNGEEVILPVRAFDVTATISFSRLNESAMYSWLISRLNTPNLRIHWDNCPLHEAFGILNTYDLALTLMSVHAEYNGQYMQVVGGITHYWGTDDEMYPLSMAVPLSDPASSTIKIPNLFRAKAQPKPEPISPLLDHPRKIDLG